MAHSRSHVCCGSSRATVAWLLFAVCVLTAATTAAPFTPCQFPNFDAAIDHFSKIIQFNTVSDSNMPHHVLHEEEFAKLNAYLPTAYPELWQQLKVEKVWPQSTYTSLYGA